jgi:ketosteroid isomerase-like protein
MRKLATLVTLILAAGCSDEPATDLEALQSMREAWQAAFDARDAAGIAALYAANGSVHPPNAKTVKNRRAIEDFWENFLAAGVGGQINDTEVYAVGDVGYKAGTYMVTDSAGAPIDVGKYVEIWRHKNGKWQLLHDIYNSDMPLPEPPLPAGRTDDEAEVFDDELEIPDEEAGLIEDDL